MIEIRDFKGDLWQMQFIPLRATNNQGFIEIWFPALCQAETALGNYGAIPVPLFNEWWRE